MQAPLGLLAEGAGGELDHLGFGDFLECLEVDVVEGLDPGEMGGPEPSHVRALAAGEYLGLEHLSELLLVGPAAVAGALTK